MSPLDPAARHDLERLFAEDAAARFQRLAGCLDELAAGHASAEAPAFEAHALRGAAATVQRDDLARLCASIEMLIAESDRDPEQLRAAARLARRAGAELRRPTRFTVELDGDASRDGAAGQGHAPLAPPSDSAPRRVLYIEDNRSNMKLVELLLRGRDIDFHGASTAAEGIASALAEPPDLILLDLQLPDGTGEDVLRALRAAPSLRAVPIVMLSAQAARDTVKRLLELGADDYLTKPFEVERAADLIERLLRRGN